MQLDQTISIKKSDELYNAYMDIKEGCMHWRLWHTLGLQDIKLRYRRSQLGPFWITLNTAIMIYAIGFVYSNLFRINLSEYYPFLASGLLGWYFISSLINETATGLIEATSFIKQMKAPFSMHIMKIVYRNLLIFFHNIVVFVPIALYFHVPITFSSLGTLLIGLCIIALYGMFFGGMIAMLGARFRDIQQIIQSIVQVSFLLTPIMWRPQMLNNHSILVKINPFYQLIQWVRVPLTGGSLSVFTIEYTLTLLCIGACAYLYCLFKYRTKIVFWIS